MASSKYNYKSGSLFLLANFFKDNLRTLYWVEKHSLKILSKFQKLATTKYLKAGFKGHHDATIIHITRLEKIFSLLNQKALFKECFVIGDIFKESKLILTHTEKKSLIREVELLNTIQKIEQYEIINYSRLIRIAKALGEIDIAIILNETLLEENEAEETFDAIKDDTFNDILFKTIETDYEQSEAAE